jgi:hypothetical protein
MTDQLHPDLARLQQQYMQLFQAVTDQTMTVDQAMATLAAMKAFDGAGYEWSYTPAGQLVKAAPGQPGQPAEPWEFTPPQLPPHASDPGLQRPGGGFPPQAPSGFGGPSSGFPPQAPSGFGGPSPDTYRPQPSSFGTPPARSLPADLSGQPTKAKNPLAGKLGNLVGGNLKLIGVAVLCVVLLVVGLGQLRGGDSGPTVADLPATPPPAPVEVPIIPLPVPAEPGGSSDDAASAGTTAPDGDRVLAVFAALRSADVALLAAAIAEPAPPLPTRLLAAQLAGFNLVGLELVADPAAPSGEGQATQTWRVVDRDSAETLNTLTIVWVLRDGVWLVSSVPPLG